ncbi:MAG: hypothetical protein J07HR59_00791 [Halorubrum sp. J07HR59]|nr:MAG: hypothetical protein J07HR59_00791 [Halorubrum sp. J07HR59]
MPDRLSDSSVGPRRHSLIVTRELGSYYIRVADSSLWWSYYDEIALFASRYALDT